MKNEGESLIYNTEKQLRENDGKLSQDIKDRIRADIASVNEAISSHNAENLKNSLEKLRNSAMEMGRSIYQGASQNQGDSTQTEQPKSEEAPKEEEQNKKQ